MDKYRKLDLFTLELGKGFCTKRCLDEILKTAATLREEALEQYGVVIPSVCIKSNPQLKSLEYVIKLNGASAGGFIFKKGYVVIVDTGKVKAGMEGKPVKDPVFGADAFMIPGSKKEEAEKKGYKILTSQKIIEVHLRETIKDNLSSIITTQYVTELLSEINTENGALYSLLFKKYESKTVQIIKDVLKALLEEDVSIRNILPILETIADEEKAAKESFDDLVGKVRYAIAPDIFSSYVKNNQLNSVLVSADFTNYLIEQESKLERFSYDTSIRKKFIDEFSNVRKTNGDIVLVCHHTGRQVLKKYLTNICMLQKVPVVSEIEFVSAIKKLGFDNNLICEIAENIVSQQDEHSGKTESQKETKKESVVQKKKSFPTEADFAKLKEEVEKVMVKLSPFEQEIFAMRFGLVDGKSHSLEEVEEAFDISKEEIRMIEAKVLRMLRHPKDNSDEN